ncbi:MAG: carbohydrate-binding family 9-like protein [Acidobacteriota bacterium]
MTNQNQIVEARFTQADLALKDLDNREWDNATPVQIDHYWSGEPAPVGRHAEARILWSERALYVRYLCNQPEPLVIKNHPQTITKTMYLWDRDVCEIFIAPALKVPERYFEFEVAPTGEWLDIGLDWTSGKRQTEWQFSSRMTTTARIEADRVTMAMRIPWSYRLPLPQKGEHRRANLFRCVGTEPKLRYLAWQPTRTPQPFFHVPEAFGWLVFS